MSADNGTHVVCKKCGATRLEDQGPCGACGAIERLWKKPLTATLSFQGNKPGIAMEGDPHSAEGRRVESRPSSGGFSRSTIDREGSYQVDLGVGLEIGRHAETQALSVLVEALARRGFHVRKIPGADDGRGEDALLQINGERYVVQFVTLPVETTLWQRLYRATVAATTGTKANAIALVRAAFIKKRHKAKGTILVLDAAHVGVLASPTIVEQYLAVHGDPVEEFSLRQAWILGVTARSAFQFEAQTSA